MGAIATPRPGPGEILVKVHATALNPVDWKIRKYGIILDHFPAIHRLDIAGEVSRSTLMFPQAYFNLSYDEAAAIPVEISTAWFGLYHALPNGFGLDAPISASARGKYKDAALVILGGATSVGKAGARVQTYIHNLYSQTYSPFSHSYSTRRIFWILSYNYNSLSEGFRLVSRLRCRAHFRPQHS